MARTVTVKEHTHRFHITITMEGTTAMEHTASIAVVNHYFGTSTRVIEVQITIVTKAYLTALHNFNFNNSFTMSTTIAFAKVVSLMPSSMVKFIGCHLYC